MVQAEQDEQEQRRERQGQQRALEDQRARRGLDVELLDARRDALALRRGHAAVAQDLVGGDLGAADDDGHASTGAASSVANGARQDGLRARADKVEVFDRVVPSARAEAQDLEDLRRPVWQGSMHAPSARDRGWHPCAGCSRRATSRACSSAPTG